MKHYIYNKLFSIVLFFLTTQGIIAQTGTQYIQYTYDNAGNPITKTNVVVGIGCAIAEQAKIANKKDIIKELSDAEIKKEFGIAVAPNPTKDIVHVSFDQDLLDDNTSVTIYNALGKVVLEMKVLDNTIALSMESFPSGIYYLRLRTQAVNLQYVVEKL
jgi:Secretion system C-terminal sorting domain